MDELVRYLTDEQDTSNRVGAITATNCVATTVTGVVKEMIATQAENTRAKSDKTYHLVISFPPGERPTPDVVRQIEQRLCVALGYGEHQRISVVHGDTDHLHVHVAINKIHPHRRTIHQPRRDYRTLGLVCSQLEREYGLQVTNHQAQRSVSSARVADIDRHSGLESLATWVRDVCLSDLRAASSWEQFRDVLLAHGVRPCLRGSGLVFEVDEGPRVKASTVARDLSKPALEGRLGVLDPRLLVVEQDDDPVAGRGLRYRRAPPLAPLQESRAALWQEYQAQMDKAATDSFSGVRAARLTRDEGIAAALRKSRLRRAAIQLLGDSAANKRLLYAQARRALKSDLAAARLQCREQIHQVRTTHRRTTWSDWVQERDPSTFSKATHDRQPQSGSQRNRRGPRGSNERASADRSRRAAVHSSERGTDRAPVALGGRSIRQVGQQPDPWRLGSLPPPHRRDGLRTLSSVPVVRFTQGSEVLLPRDVPDRLEFQRAEPAHSLRRHDAGGDNALTDANLAAERYLAERESKRALGVDIPKHKRYVASREALTWAGFRRVDGHPLALLRSPCNEILILPVTAANAERFDKLHIGAPITVTSTGAVQRQRHPRTATPKSPKRSR
ncbi:TraI/MobA(P) family conjugative relaxase [Thiocystis violacea]|uniref:TraI/MobA(P) family conjugative relaxase n=1 Tax=Thiocystis violacea TaxID=13725 RepID=UPI0019053DE0|nr:TraI/MobA(P) family conjugative relaxase [Thiocystis violacea]